MVSGKSDLIDISCEIIRETEKAFLVDAGLDEHIWLPKSQIQIIDENNITIPLWLAREKGIS